MSGFPVMGVLAVGQQCPYEVDNDCALTAILRVHAIGKLIGKGWTGRSLASCGERYVVGNSGQLADCPDHCRGWDTLVTATLEL